MSSREYAYGPWPGRGPFSHLPPWWRPGRWYGRGACWSLFGPRFPTQANPNEEMEFLKWQKEALEEELKQVKERLKNLGEAETSENKPVT